MKTLQFVSVLFLIFFVACDSKSTDTASKSSEISEPSAPAAITPKPEPKPDNRIPLQLDGLYATSTDLSSDIRNAFDQDPSTIWKTKSGTGPDEGIMLYFSEPMMIESIRIEQAEGENFSNVNYTLYGNGAPLDDAIPGQKTPINQELLNMYLRFSTDENIKITSSPFEDEFYDEFRVERFDKNKRIAIKNITINGPDGEFKIVAPKMIKGSVGASSTLKAESFAYDPSLLFDARKEFVWVEGEKGNGEGVKLMFSFDQEVNIAGLQIWNGYQRSESHFNSNAKLKGFAFGVAESALTTYQLKDVQGSQIIKLKEPIKGKSFELEIQSAYKGWSYQDLAISEILFFDEADALFGIQSQKTIEHQYTIQQKTKGTVLEELLDSRIYNAYTSDEYPLGMDRCVILRSDGTFVIYSSEEDESYKVSTVADGNWEILSADKESATISVFGKFLDFNMMEMYYAGKSDAELSRVFRDKVTIKNNMLKGEKLIDAIKF